MPSELWIILFFRLQSRGKPLWNHKSGSQAVCLKLMMQLENIVSQTEKRPFHFHLHRASEQKTAEVHILFYHGKDALCLNTAIDAQELSLLAVDFFFHRFSLGRKTLGDIEHLVPLFQRLFAPTGTDALLLQRAARARLAAVYGSGEFKTIL